MDSQEQQRDTDRPRDADLDAFVATARRFARREVAPLVGTEGRDGRLERLPQVLEGAFAAGLLTSPDPGAPGHEYGIWGSASEAEGPAASLSLLAEIARECAGVAATLHAAGVGTWAALAHPASGVASAELGTRPALAMRDRSGRLEPRFPWQPPPEAAQVVGGRLAGVTTFVHAAPGTDGYVVLAAAEASPAPGLGPEETRGWERWYVPAGCDALDTEAVEPRTGLGAVRVRHLRLEGIAAPPARRLGPAPAALVEALLSRWLLGLGAIAVGNARGALRTAARYAAERYQGGALIQAHPAVRDLLASSQSHLALCEAALRDAGRPAEGGAGAASAPAAAADASTPGPGAALVTAAALKYRLCEQAREAVSDCLQVLGGYGYMEEYRQEKRLRDALTLECLWPGPADCRRLLAARVLATPQEGS